MRRPALLLLASLLMTASATAAAGQGIVRTTLTPAAVIFPPPGVSDFTAGYIDAPPISVEVMSRPSTLSWELQIRADAPHLGGYGKSIGDILWRPDGSTVWQPLSTADQLLTSGEGDQALLVHFRMRLDWVYDEPGTYAVSFTLTGVRR